MTIKDIDAATLEVIDAASQIMAAHGLTPGVMHYVLNAAQASLSDLRVREYINMMADAEAAQNAAETPQDGKEEPQGAQEREPTKKRHSVSLDALKEKIEKRIAEKVEAGDVDGDGLAHVSLKEITEA